MATKMTVRETLKSMKSKQNVKLIFSLYLSGLSILKIIRELKKRDIKSPTDKDTWYKRTIDTMLINKKYTDHVVSLKNNESTPSYEFKDTTNQLFLRRSFKRFSLRNPKEVMLKAASSSPKNTVLTAPIKNSVDLFHS